MPKVTVNGVELAYETFGYGEPLVLIMGIGGQMVLWDENFCRALADKGFHVIRFDNRDAGQSSQLDHLPTYHPRDVLRRRLLGKTIKAAYTLDDMADDTIGLLDALGLPWAHVVGMSLGGMVAQCLALRYPRRVRSLALIMSNTGELWVNVPARRAYSALISKAPRSREELVQRQVHLFRAMGASPHRTPEERVAEIAGQHYDRGIHPRGFARQYAALMASPGRLGLLGRILAPTVVIHGAEDPLVRPLGGRLLACGIPGARFALIGGMGHDLSPSVWPRVIDEITTNSKRVQGAPRNLARSLRALFARPISVTTR